MPLEIKIFLAVIAGVFFGGLILIQFLGWICNDSREEIEKNYSNY